MTITVKINPIPVPVSDWKMNFVFIPKLLSLLIQQECQIQSPKDM